MSLVAYEASSDEDSDYEDNIAPKAIVIQSTSVAKGSQLLPSKNVVPNDYISDEEDDFISHVDGKDADLSIKSISQLLPKPKNEAYPLDIFENVTKPTFSALPTPKASTTTVDIEENDDEFLHKKPNKEEIENSKKDVEVRKMPVKITIPSLKNFKDVEKEMSDKAKNRSIINPTKSSISSGLLSILPRAKSERCFAKLASNSGEDDKTVNATTSVKPVVFSFVPDTVKHRRPATNTEDVDRLKPIKKNLHNHTSKPSLQSDKAIDSDGSDDDNMGDGDFFSFNSDQSLPNVSTTEINALVAKKAAKIAETTKNYLNANELQKCNDVQEMQIDKQDLKLYRRHQEQQLNSEALQALVGGSTKRRRQQESDIQVIDLNSSQVLPSKEEWMRTALASSTAFQPTGVLVDEEPASGTRRKHQITYLAHKAKANEAELQAMWSANRQNRRATQSKYGF